MLLSKFTNIKIEGISVAAPSKRIPVEYYNEAFGEEVVEKICRDDRSEERMQGSA